MEPEEAAAAGMTLDRCDVVLYLLTELPQHNSFAHRNFGNERQCPGLLRCYISKESAMQEGWETHYKINSYWHFWQNSSLRSPTIFLCLQTKPFGKQDVLVQTCHSQLFKRWRYHIPMILVDMVKGKKKCFEVKQHWAEIVRIHLVVSSCFCSDHVASNLTEN